MPSSNQPESLQQEVVFPVTPDRVYAALTEEAQHAAFTGGVSKISKEVGGAFSGHDGQIVGFQLELVPNERIVQAWRVTAWPAGVFSLVRYDLAADGDGTRVTLHHSALPEGASEMIGQGWQGRYWEPMRAHFAA